MKDLGIITEQDANKIGQILHKQHNALTSGRYDFTACQLDIMFMILASLKNNESQYQIHVTDIESITGRKWNIAQLTESTEGLLTRMFEVEMEDGYTQFVLFQYFKYLKGTRTIEIKLSEISLPYFFELKNNFTHFQLKSVLDCSSSYAKRLYMLACQWRAIGKFPRPIPILELKKMLGLVDKKGNEQYGEITGFKTKVLDIAKKQINEHTDIHFDYELYKKGRSFTHIQLFVQDSKNKPEQLEIDFQKDIELQKNVRNVMAYGLTKQQAEAIVKDGYDKFLHFIEEVNKKAKKGEIKVENAAAYIIGTYQKKGVIPKLNK
ncbi:RepB family plasmid replication initiator protein [bacterium]|nr:MAG: RepB family plasmid replication initiator protein [bacterium]